MSETRAICLAAIIFSGAEVAGQIPTLELIISDLDWIGSASQNPWRADDGRVGQMPGIDPDPLSELREAAIARHMELGADPDQVKETLQAPEHPTVTVEGIDWVVPQIVEVPSSHVKRKIFSKLYLPPDFNPEQRYPAVMFVRGAGYLDGIYGGSYGGFMTFMALFRVSGTFAVGMQDDNVFFQASVLLVQRLVELKKEDFGIAIYPLDPRGFVHPESWLDEYRRIFKLMERYLK